MKIQIQLLFNEWYDIDIENLRKDNIIRVFKDGELLKDEYGFTERKCISNAEYNEELETWTIESIGIKLNEL